MRTKILFVVLVVMVSLLTACAGVSSVSTPDPTLQAASNEASIKQGIAGTQTAQAVVSASTTPTLTLASVTPTLTPTKMATTTPTATQVAILQLKTAEDMRAFGRVLGWVTGGNAGQWVAGAQIELKADFELKTLPNGAVYEFECVHYTVLNGEVHAEPVCKGALVRFDTNSIVPEGTVGTFWLSWAVKGSTTEKWLEGFINLPCKCPNGDCRVS